MLQLTTLKDQVVYLTTELSASREEVESKSAEMLQLKGALDLLRGSASALSVLTVSQCEQLEQQLRNSLEAVEARKVCVKLAFLNIYIFVLIYFHRLC